MDMMEYREARRKYMVLDAETMRLAATQQAFGEFESQVEVYHENGYERDNDGKDILDITAGELDGIIADFVQRDCEEGQWCRDEMMRNAVLGVAGLRC